MRENTVPNASVKMKGYVVTEDSSGFEMAVYAETASKAKYKSYDYFREYFEETYWNFGDYVKNVTVRRRSRLDEFYRGKSVMDWEDAEDRIVLVRELGWHCWSGDSDYEENGCPKCSARKWCAYGKDYIDGSGKHED